MRSWVNTLRARFRDERGFSNALLMIVAMPVVLGALGFAFDTARLTYVAETLQSRAELAVQSATNMASTSVTGLVTFDTDAATAAQTIYCSNTAAARGTMLAGTCQASVSTVGAPVTVAQMCSASAAGAPRYGLTIVARETVPTVFLRILGVRTVELSNVTGTALLRARNC